MLSNLAKHFSVAKEKIQSYLGSLPKDPSPSSTIIKEVIEMLPVRIIKVHNIN